ncbi:hypothetical protein U9M48_000393 [Paspalum notatum var. saurae]|uniref:C2H2-type domain-containing protein n=1 Tax=Paspalum notatum var. saurae TaxID=547442 RepID=A0AAQ3PMA7_PASNO
MATTTAPRPTPPAANVLRLFLSVATDRKVISKQHGGGGGGGAFRCRTCGRAFATFQALGGHRTSHKRPRVRAHGLDLLLGARPGKSAAAGDHDAHRCNTCGLVFPTGQALGGHMRRHRPAAAAAATIKFVALSSSQEGHDDSSEDDDDDTTGLLHTATSGRRQVTSPARAAAGVRVPDVRAPVRDVPGAGRPPDQPPPAPPARLGGEDEARGGPRVRHLWAGLRDGPGTRRTHEEAPLGRCE